MMAIIIGAASYVFFALYDYCFLLKKNRSAYWWFVIGGILLSTATIYLFNFHGWPPKWAANPGLKMLEAAGALLFLLLLFYTLFFALPLKSYASQGGPALVQSGVYALCRHPGVWWLAGFYLFAWLLCEQTLMLVAGVVFSLLNVIYVGWQDRFVFVQSIEGYDQYQKRTPFLFPTGKSIRQCFRSSLMGPRGKVS